MVHTAPAGATNAAGFELSTTTGFVPYGHSPNDSAVSNVLRPMTSASTVAMNSVYPCGSPPSAGNQSSALTA
jgi:hypothetical protein